MWACLVFSIVVGVSCVHCGCVSRMSLWACLAFLSETSPVTTSDEEDMQEEDELSMDISLSSQVRKKVKTMMTAP